MIETTFYCGWCNQRKPVGTGYVEMSRRRKKCSDCRQRTRRAS